ncbi:MAG: DUF86 domain-containing protein [Thermodesulfobacteriota bacterium]
MAYDAKQIYEVSRNLGHVPLIEEGILPAEEGPVYEKMAAFRNLLVHHYEKIDDAAVFGIFKKHLNDFHRFIGHIL